MKFLLCFISVVCMSIGANAAVLDEIDVSISGQIEPSSERCSVSGSTVVLNFGDKIRPVSVSDGASISAISPSPITIANCGSSTSVQATMDRPADNSPVLSINNRLQLLIGDDLAFADMQAIVMSDDDMADDRLAGADAFQGPVFFDDGVTLEVSASISDAQATNKTGAIAVNNEFYKTRSGTDGAVIYFALGGSETIREIVVSIPGAEDGFDTVTDTVVRGFGTGALNAVTRFGINSLENVNELGSSVFGTDGELSRPLDALSGAGRTTPQAISTSLESLAVDIGDLTTDLLAPDEGFSPSVSDD